MESSPLGFGSWIGLRIRDYSKLGLLGIHLANFLAWFIGVEFFQENNRVVYWKPFGWGVPLWEDRTLEKSFNSFSRETPKI